MATVKYTVRGKKNPTRIYVKFVASREVNYLLATPLSIDPKHFNNKTGKLRKVATFKEYLQLQNTLNELSTYLLNQYNTDVKNGNVSGSSWLKDCLNIFFNVKDKNDLNFLSNYISHYLEKIQHKQNARTKSVGVELSTLKKYKTVQKKVLAFEKKQSKKYRLIDVNLAFREKFLKYLLDTEKIGLNTSGRYLKVLKTFCIDAQKNGLDVSKELTHIQGFTVEAEKITLTTQDIEQIEATTFKNEALKTAKDWLIIGCYIGQRGGDLLSLTSENLTNNGNLEFINLKQQKTQKQVSILVHPKVKSILKSRGGQFPPKYSKNLQSSLAMFNRYIKKVCETANLIEPTKGGKINPKTNRKQKGVYPKWELVTSHICRRSFATNFYTEIPTPLLMNITGHSTEKEFLNYIGKTSLDYGEQMAKYWNLESQKQNIKQGEQPTPLKAVN